MTVESDGLAETEVTFEVSIASISDISPAEGSIAGEWMSMRTWYTADLCAGLVKYISHICV